MRIHIPGRGPLELDHLVFDFNGTLACDGRITDEVLALLAVIAQKIDLIVATADTFGTAATTFEPAGIAWRRIKTGGDKAQLVEGFGGNTAVVGNGANDAMMFRAADLAVAVVGPEGAASAALLAADIVVSSIEAGLELFLHPNRIVATLRE